MKTQPGDGDARHIAVFLRSLGGGGVEMLENPERRRELGRRGRAWVQETMDLERSLDRYAAFYPELASSVSPVREVRP